MDTGRVGRRVERWRNSLHLGFCLALYFLPDPERNIVVNVQPGDNHGGPDDWESVLEEVKLACLNIAHSDSIHVGGVNERRSAQIFTPNVHQGRNVTRCVFFPHLTQEALQLAFLYKELHVEPPGAPRRRKK